MALTPAYAVDGGRVPASMLRMVTWATSAGSQGVVQAGDLGVTALGTPGAAVNIAPGGALLNSLARGQSYAAMNDATVQLAIPATGSGAGRTDYIILRIEDWHFDTSAQPADPKNALYCSFQRVTSTSGLNYPFIVLAKIVIPASTATITKAMITDMRKVANPRTKRVLRPNAVVTSETETLTSTVREYFPNAGGLQLVDIPSWATRVKIRADWLMVKIPAGDCWGTCWVSFGDWTGTSWGTQATTSQEFSFDGIKSTNISRQSWTVVDDLAIPANLRGREVHFQMWAKKIGPVGPIIDALSGASLDLLFEEVADLSDS